MSFEQATSANLPEVNYIVVHEYFLKCTDFMSAEFRSAKNLRATRAGYDDEAIGYVQLKRESNICTVQGKIVPEQKVRNKTYLVKAIFDETEEKVVSCKCEGCAASKGGCKHAIAFLYWLLRRTDEKSPTSVECYWRKPILAHIGISGRHLKACEFTTGAPATTVTAVPGFLNKVLDEVLDKDIKAQLLMHFRLPGEEEALSLHHLFMAYRDHKTQQVDVQSFISFCSSTMTHSNCQKAAVESAAQRKSPLWFELRYGRITASKIFEAARCRTLDGSLVESILGGISIPETEAIKRGIRLEEEVLREVMSKKKLKVHQVGLILSNIYPMLGASPDGVTDTHVIEIKCPSSHSTVSNYLSNDGRINPKCLAQICLQMLFCNKRRGLFCVASPNFEETKEVTVVEVPYCKAFIEDSIKFWENAIYPILSK